MIQIIVNPTEIKRLFQMFFVLKKRKQIKRNNTVAIENDKIGMKKIYRKINIINPRKNILFSGKI